MWKDHVASAVLQVGATYEGVEWSGKLDWAAWSGAHWLAGWSEFERLSANELPVTFSLVCVCWPTIPGDLGRWNGAGIFGTIPTAVEKCWCHFLLEIVGETCELP